MAIKLTPLQIVHPGSGYDTNTERCHMFAHAGIHYLQVCTASSISHQNHMWWMYAELPLMHQAVELLLKAHAARVDISFSPREYGHKTTDIVKNYAARVNVFSKLATDQAVLDLLDGLQQAWLAVRYAEVAVEYDGSDYKMAESICNLLADEHFHETNVPLLPRHFEKLKQQQLAEKSA